MARTNSPDAKNRILQAAVRVFAEKSYEGSRIEEIAKEANVPKSLIYYHFKSKSEILEVLMSGFIREYTELIRVGEKDTHQEKAEALSGRMQSHYSDFAIKNADLIRIILIDSLKKSNQKPLIYQIVEAVVEADEKSALAENAKNYDRNERLVAEFFSSVIPSCAYLCFEESWTNYFGLDKKKLGELFLKTMAATHGAYHKYHG